LSIVFGVAYFVYTTKNIPIKYIPIKIGFWKYKRKTLTERLDPFILEEL
jgi:hypothetical protein